MRHHLNDARIAERGENLRALIKESIFRAAVRLNISKGKRESDSFG